MEKEFHKYYLLLLGIRHNKVAQNMGQRGKQAQVRTKTT